MYTVACCSDADMPRERGGFCRRTCARVIIILLLISVCIGEIVAQQTFYREFFTIKFSLCLSTQLWSIIYIRRQLRANPPLFQYTERERSNFSRDSSLLMQRDVCEFEKYVFEKSRFKNKILMNFYQSPRKFNTLRRLRRRARKDKICRQ